MPQSGSSEYLRAKHGDGTLRFALPEGRYTEYR